MRGHPAHSGWAAGRGTQTNRRAAARAAGTRPRRCRTPPTPQASVASPDPEGRTRLPRPAGRVHTPRTVVAPGQPGVGHDGRKGWEGPSMMRRALTLGAAAALLVILVGGSVSATGSAVQTSFTVVERATTDTVIDLGAKGDSRGDMLMFGNNVYNAANTTKIGRDEGSCWRTNPGKVWECSWTTVLSGGSLVVQGPFFDSGQNSILAITGGTGIYRNARGQMTLHSRNKAGSEYDFIFSVNL